MLLESFYTRELWFCHLAEFRTNPLSFDMFRLNLSQTLVLVCQGVSKAGHKMHILALMCTIKDCIMIYQNVYKKREFYKVYVNFCSVEHIICFIWTSRIRKKHSIFPIHMLLKNRKNAYLCLYLYLLNSNIPLTDTVRFPHGTSDADIL